MGELQVVGDAAVGEIQIIGLSRELACESIDLLDHRHDAKLLAAVAHVQALGFGKVLDLLVLDHSPCNLEVAEALALSFAQQVGRHLVDVVILFQFLIGTHYALELLEEPLVNLGEVVNLIDRIASLHGLGDDKNTLVGRFAESLVDVIDLNDLVFDKAMHTLTNHTETLLYCLFECSSDCHHLAHRLHA